MGSAGAARRALQLALNHANGRKAFGHKLIHQPLMRNLLADLCVESEAHTMNAMYMARAFDRYYTASSSSAEDIETEKELFRIGVSVSKYFVTKRLPGFVYECMEALGGNGYVEDFPMARLFRQSPLNAIWEGSGNVIALDILRGHAALPILLKDIQQVRGSDSRLDAYVAQVEATVNAVRKDPLSLESQRGARNLVDRLALALQASILVRYGDKQIAEAFLASRIPSVEGSAARGANFGGYAVYNEALTDSILSRNMPVFEV
uniref:Acyl-CoA dehydrogenase/oxidase C-terminal domain-containing protein n=1 Tax=Spumella elongata TaxID=89044 RepID=A0A7S3HQP3_9STRA